MNLTPYRRVLRQPGMRVLTLTGFLARIPATAIAMTITLHVVTSLDLGYAQAGIAGASGMAGAAVGSPLAGRLIDRLGSRPVVAVTTAAQGLFWVVAPGLGFDSLVICAFLAGLVSLPIFGLMRQFLAAMVPPDQRRTAFALDSMAVEVAYMLGPALAVGAVTVVGSRATMYGLAVGMVAAGMSLIILDPPTRSPDEPATGAQTVRRRQWLTRRLVVALGVTSAVTFALSATEISLVAILRDNGATAWTGLVVALWSAYSIVGGFLYGGLRKSPSPLLLIAGLGAFTIPIGAVSGAWWSVLVILIPAGVLCSPSLAATVDTVSAWVPAAARGVAMGLHGTAITVGIAAGAPAAGAVIDAVGPSWGFVVGGGFAVIMVLAAVPLWPREERREPTPGSVLALEKAA